MGEAVASPSYRAKVVASYRGRVPRQYANNVSRSTF
jgi:hypothetical protein